MNNKYLSKREEPKRWQMYFVWETGFNMSYDMELVAKSSLKGPTDL